jgi:glycosyltransferase involved in cell wall biosynthesis
MKKITVLIPCYNEADAIGNVISRFPRQYLRAAGFNLEIIVIDNNSTDDTAILAAAAGATVISETKKGKGNAILTGFNAIGKDTDYVVMLDGDDTYRPEEIMRLVEPLDSGFASVIIGSRLHGYMRDGSMKRFNRFGSRAYTRMVRSAYKVMVTDVLTGYMAWNREVIENLRTQINSSGFAIEMEMITKIARMGYKIFSVPITYEPRLGSSSLNPVRDGYTILRMYVRNLYWRPTTVSLSDVRTGNSLGVRRLRTTDILRIRLLKDKAKNEASENSLSL